MTTVTAIVACHNRREKTLSCLAAFFSQELTAETQLSAVLADGGSTDGTPAAVGASYPKTKVIEGDNSLYWAGAMALAEAQAMVNKPDFLLWLNDDVVLDKDAVERLLQTFRSGSGACIVVGAVRDLTTGDLTYSGLVRRGRHPLEFDLVHPHPRKPIPVHTFNGNVVLVASSIFALVGSIDAKLVHAAADLDYGLRAARRGIPSVLAPCTVGVCERDGTERPWLLPDMTVRQRFSALFAIKGLHPPSRARYLIRHGGMLWPVFWAAPYISATVSILRLWVKGGQAEWA